MTAAETVQLAALREAPLSVEEVLCAVGGAGVGGSALFVGTVRDSDGGRAVTSLEYQAHPSAAVLLQAVCEQVAQEPGVIAVGAVHRLGMLGIGELAVIVAVGAAHRAEAFAAARILIDRVKGEVPIWKLQTYADGSEDWVGAGCEPG